MLRDGYDIEVRRASGLWIAAVALLCLISAASLSLLLPLQARAGCGGVQKTKAEKKVNPGGHAPLAVGDSTMLLALPNLARAGFRVNARGCRGWSEGMHVLKDYKREGRLPHLVAIALGADYSITRRDIRHALHIAGPKRVLALVTPRELGGGSGSDADAVRHAYRKHTKRVVLLDWVRYSRGEGGWFQPDGLHLTFSGAHAFAKLMHKSVKFAPSGEFPHHSRYPR